MVRYSIMMFSLVILSFGQTGSKQVLFDQSTSHVKSINYYIAVNHLHEDFFHKAFSYQGVEPGIIINKNMAAGIFMSTFASNLKVKTDTSLSYVTSWKSGVTVGEILFPDNVVHTGWQVAAGYFSMQGNEKKVHLFSDPDARVHIKGMILVPEVYAEANVLRWLKFKTGIAYSFFSFEDQSEITSDEINGIGIDFNFVFTW